MQLAATTCCPARDSHFSTLISGARSAISEIANRPRGVYRLSTKRSLASIDAFESGAERKFAKCKHSVECRAVSSDTRSHQRDTQGDIKQIFEHANKILNL